LNITMVRISRPLAKLYPELLLKKENFLQSKGLVDFFNYFQRDGKHLEPKEIFLTPLLLPKTSTHWKLKSGILSLIMKY